MAPRGNIGRAPCALVDLLQGDEQRPNHRCGFGRAQNFRKPPQLDAQRLIHRQLQSLIDDLHDGASGGIIIKGLPAIDSVRRSKHRHAGCRLDGPARQFEAVDIPRRLGGTARRNPILGGFDEFASGDHGIDELHRLSAVDLKVIAFQQKLQRVGRLHHARDALRTTAAGEKADFDLRQAEPRLVVCCGDAVVTGEHEFETAADRSAVDRRDPGLAAGFDAAAKLRELAAFFEYIRIRRPFASRCHDLGKRASHRFQHHKIGAGTERVLA